MVLEQRCCALWCWRCFSGYALIDSRAHCIDDTQGSLGWRISRTLLQFATPKERT